MTTLRRAFIMVTTVAVVALAVSAYHLNTTWDSRTRAVRAMLEARGVLADERETLDSAQRRVRWARVEARRAVAERDGAQLSVQDRRAQLVAIEADRDHASGVRDALSAEVQLVRQCLAGASTALDALRRRDNPATIAALQSVDGACRAAQSGTSRPSARYGFDFPDPFVLTVGADAYAFATNSGGGNIQVLRRQADGTWATHGDGLGQFPAWAGWGRTWAPAVLARPGGFVLYYTVRESVTGRQCISRAVAVEPGGPYIDTSTGPLECGERNAIDPEAVVAADGNPVLLWKHEHPNTIVARQLAPDGLSLVGPEHELLTVTAAWESNNIEAPSMLVTPTGAWLFFSGNDWNSRRYATGVVHCASALGPCDRASGAPWLASHGSLVGPGGASVYQESPGQFRLAYHGYRAPNVGFPASRLLFIGALDLSSGRPALVE